MHSRTPPGRSTRAHSRSTAVRRADVLQDACREDRVEAGCRERQRPPVGVELDPPGGGRGIGGRGLAQHVGRDVATGHPQPRASQMPGQFAGAAAEIKHPPSRGHVVPNRIGQLRQPTDEPAIRRVLGGPTARLGVKEQPYLLPRGPAPAQPRPPWPLRGPDGGAHRGQHDLGRQGRPTRYGLVERRGARSVSLVRPALPDRFAVRLGGPEVVDGHPVRTGLDLDPLLAGHRIRTAVRDDGQ